MRFAAHVIFSILYLFASVVFPRPALAVISSCTATVSPTSAVGNAGASFSFSISASGTVWIKVTRPSSNFTIQGSTLGGWTATVTESDVTYTGGSGSSIGPSLSAAVANTTASSANWTVQVSDDSGGASPTTCTGTLGTEITTPAPTPVSAPSISNIVVSDVADTSVKITWDTDQSATSQVDYGKTTDYGSTKSDSSSVTSHSLSLSSLSANTTYHYNITSSNDNGSATSGDNTFVTAKSGSTGTTQTGTTTTITVKATPTPTPIPDKTPPAITINTKLDPSYTQSPTIEGKATDPAGVDSVQYTIDDGRNWLPVDELSNPGKSSTAFSFTPLGLEDGNFDLKVRATDGKGNTGSGKSLILVIDRLPPLVGAMLITLGPQVVEPVEGMVNLLTGLNYKITLSAVGGPTEVEINGNILKKNADNGLWSGTLSFEKPGAYTLETRALDGANNRTHRQVGTVTALQNGGVFSGDRPVEGANVFVYYLDRTSRRFTLWDANAYSQENPQKTGSGGLYKLFLPPGTYYIEVTAHGYKPLVTTIFEIESNLTVIERFSLAPRLGFWLGRWFVAIPGVRQTSMSLTTHGNARGVSAGEHALVGTELPYFRLQADATDLVSHALRGKPSVFTFINTWSPQTALQLAELVKLSEKKELNVVGIIPQESVSAVSIFRRRGGYPIPIVADPDGTLIEPLAIASVPTHVFVNRKGVITAVKTGFLQKESLLDAIIK